MLGAYFAKGLKSRTHRDQVNKKVMAEMEKEAEKWKDMPMPGFKVSVSG